jgi:hypothetical protein
MAAKYTLLPFSISLAVENGEGANSVADIFAGINGAAPAFTDRLLIPGDNLYSSRVRYFLCGKYFSEKAVALLMRIFKAFKKII